MRLRNGKNSSLDFSKAKSLTEQSHRDEVKIQNIIKRHQTTGMVTHLNHRQPLYQDFTNAPDFYKAQKIIADANSVFEEVPAKIRQQFNNDPGKYLEFVQNPDNREEMENLGIDSSHIPEDYVKPLTDAEKDQIHLEEAIDAKIAQEANTSLSDATPEQLRAALAKTESQEG